MDEFEDLGFFWLPDDPKAKERVPGVLRASAQGAITLETFGLAEGEPHSLASDLTLRDGEATRRILGVTRERGFVTLDGCLRTDSSVEARSHGLIFNGATFLATWLFVGIAYDSQECVRFSRVKFDVEGLDEWLALSGIQVDADVMQGRATITFQRPDSLGLPGLLDGEHGKIRFGYSIPSAWEETKSAGVSQRAYVELSTDGWWTADEATRRVMWFRDLLRLAADQSVSVIGLTGYSREVTEPAQGGGERESEIEIIYEERNQGVADRNLLGPLMLFQRRDLKDDLHVCIGRWFAMYSEHHQPLRLYFSAVDSSRDPTLDERFRQLTEALETLDKALHGNARKDFSQRIQRLAEPFADLLELEDSCEQFGLTVAHTRNVQVHHLPIGGNDVAVGRDLLRLTYRCELLLICHFVAVITGSYALAIEMIEDKEATTKRQQVIGDR
ncbi:MAG: hypothetical protein OXH19_10535 [Chloroflexi bacterium]|nr:hypothetical protein [Chloroflexota bacterium]MCY3607346.1 hypothetical protein [Acidimicrobiaceae bacterium]MCY3589336.1 hypothetical protein [Chloroflexota bacterium]MDE2709064.1 hypothetical protein [Chloroflexota bacterium]MXY86445.1 hypothetical protein [Chloroflexota bacterium]